MVLCALGVGGAFSVPSKFEEQEGEGDKTPADGA